MDDFRSLLIKRRSCRRFGQNTLSSEQVYTLLSAALLSPTSKSNCGWEFIAVEDKEMLERLSFCKEHSASFISQASLAVVVMGNPLVSDVWIEDASIAAINIQLQAEDLGIGSCWVQLRNRITANGQMSEEYVRHVLDIPDYIEPLCVIALGEKIKESRPNDIEKLHWEQVHTGKY